MVKDSLINRRLNGFHIESLLGRGGMARVYRGIDVNLLRYVAIKVIDAPYRRDPTHTRRFAQEARVIAQLGDHPHVVNVYHYGEDQGYLFMAMQFIEGADLGTIQRSYVQDGERMPFDEILSLTWEICDALDYIHARGVIHRDLKPSNIMLDAQGRAILTDFGLALFTETGTLGEAFGSPHYIPPEQVISSAQAVAQSDLYSLGVILFELFTGRLPFDADNPMNLAMMHMSEPPPSPRLFRPDLHPAIEAVILKALAKTPQERHVTGRALYADLERAVRMSQQQPAAPAGAAKLSVVARIRRKTRPLPPPTLPGGSETPFQAGSEGTAASHQPPPPPTSMIPPPRFDQPPPPTYPEPLVIPIEARPARRGCLTRLILPIGLVLAALLVCVGGALALNSGFGGFNLPGLIPNPSSTLAVINPTAANPPEPATPQPSQPTATNRPTETPLPTATLESTPTPNGPAYDLLLVRYSADILIIANNGDEDIPVFPLDLGRSGQNGIPGYAWEINNLEPGDCLVAMRTNRRPRAPEDAGCAVLVVLQLPQQLNFWNNTFAVFYDGRRIGECKKDESSCEIKIPIGN